MDTWLKPFWPKLDRRNAVNNFDLPSSSSSSSSTSDSSLRTRSFDLYPTSFRLNGDDGEVDLICGCLGLSSPDDFAIPATEWEAIRLGYSSRARSKHKNSDDLEFRPLFRKEKYDFPVPSQFDVNSNVVGEGENESRVGDEDAVGQIPTDATFNSNDRGECIYAVRPPALSPPLDLRSVVVDVCSTSFAPKDGKHPACKFSRADENQARFEDVERYDGGVYGSGFFGPLHPENTTNGYGDELCSGDPTDVDDNGDEIESNFVSKPVHYFTPNGKFKRKNCSSWQKCDLLGIGSFGTVFEAITDDGFFFAVKEVSLRTQGSEGRDSILQLEQEISLLSQFEHENIVRYLGTDKDSSKLYIFLELLPKGSLAKLYQRLRLKKSQVAAYTRQILDGLNYLHKKNIVHRDIKCANILVDGSGSVKLADFGLAKAIKFSDVNSFKGTAYWMAPEVVNLQTRGYGLPADIWSLGCTVLEMLTGRPPYSQLNAVQALFQIGNKRLPPLPHSLSGDARDFILSCLQVDPLGRPSASQLSNHPFVRMPI